MPKAPPELIHKPKFRLLASNVLAARTFCPLLAVRLCYNRLARRSVLPVLMSDAAQRG